MKDAELVLMEIRDFADRAHGEQMRKYTPERYIVHPMRVMRLCQAVTDDIAVLSAALLHDVLEDTPVRDGAILAFLIPLIGEVQAERTLKLVVELTDVYVSSSFPNLNRKVRKAKEAQRMSGVSADAQTVKYADICDNCQEIVFHDIKFAPKFLTECLALLKLMSKGNQALRTKALAVIEKGMSVLNKQRHLKSSRS